MNYILQLKRWLNSYLFLTKLANKPIKTSTRQTVLFLVTFVILIWNICAILSVTWECAERVCSA